MIDRVFKTNPNDYSMLILRVVLGIVFFAHGAQKAFGWFGGNGFDKTMDFFTNSFGLPWIIAFMVIFIELVGSLALIFGLKTRPAACGILLIMLGAIWLVHIQNGLFLSDGGFEYNLLIIAVCITLMFKGGGAYSLDLLIYNRLKT